MNSFNIREIRPDEYPLLNDFLYEAIFVPEGETSPPREIIYLPELQVYVENFGSRAGDVCFVAEWCGVPDNCNTVQSDAAGNIGSTRVVGAAWARIMNDYGHIDDDTPSIAIALYPEYRGAGAGGALLDALFAQLGRLGYERVSLSVQKRNRALQLYLRKGFVPVHGDDEEYIMVRSLQSETSS